MRSTMDILANHVITFALGFLLMQKVRFKIDVEINKALSYQQENDFYIPIKQNMQASEVYLSHGAYAQCCAYF